MSGNSGLVGVRERPILFSGEMVRAILDGTKTQTRRVVNPQPEFFHDPDGGVTWRHGKRIGAGKREEMWGWHAVDRCPYGQPGDRLWVRETWVTGCRPCPNAGWRDGIVYRADDYPGRDERDLLPLYPAPDGVDPSDYERSGWRPSIHMPRWASRITLEITDVRVERVQDISHEDVLAEGIDRCNSSSRIMALERFEKLWNATNGPRGYGWDANPWVWAITFRPVPTQESER